MKLLPDPPPAGPNSGLWNGPEDFLDAYRRAVDESDRRYLPWDEFRHRPAPEGLSPEQWWSVVRFIRQSSARNLPLLLDVGGQAFSYVLADDLLASIDKITSSASGRISISADVTNASTRDRYVISSLIEEAITSSQLEGAATSRRVAKEMITSGRRPSNRSERMILNNFRAMQRIVELGAAELTPELVCEIHRIVTEGTLDHPGAAGRIQDDDRERIQVWSDTGDLLHRPPPVVQLEDRMARMCAFANGDDGGAYLPPVLRAIAVHFMCGYDHYFEDGNGRTARALFYWVMLREGYWLTEFLTISKLLKQGPAKYARSFLRTETDDGDVTHFFLFHLHIVLRAIDGLHDYLAMKADEVARLHEQVAGRHGDFNHRQLTLLEHALRKPGSTYTVHSHALSHHVSGETARKDLTSLVDMELLNQARQGKHYVWTSPSDLAQRLEH